MTEFWLPERGQWKPVRLRLEPDSYTRWLDIGYTTEEGAHSPPFVADLVAIRSTVVWEGYLAPDTHAVSWDTETGRQMDEIDRIIEEFG